MQTGKIDSVRASAFRVPTEEGPEAAGTLRWEATEVLVVEIHSGNHCGLGYSYTAAEPARNLVSSKLANRLLGGDPMQIPVHWRRMRDSLRNAGRPGLGMMAISAVDQALWDLKAKIFQVPLTALWGKARPYSIAYARFCQSGRFPVEKPTEAMAGCRLSDFAYQCFASR